MKFIKESTQKGLRVPAVALTISGIPLNERVEMHTLDKAVLLLKGNMTAPELLATVEQLQTMAEDLLIHLSELCGPCEDCEGGCLCGDSGDSPLKHLPPNLLLTFAETGTCLDELEEHLIKGDIVYGKGALT